VISCPCQAGLQEEQDELFEEVEKDNDLSTKGKDF